MHAPERVQLVLPAQCVKTMKTSDKEMPGLRVLHTSSVASSYVST